MTSITIDQTLAEIAKELPASLRILESYGLDYCCGGNRALGTACASAGIDPQVVLDALGVGAAEAEPDWASLGIVGLVNEIEATHHAYLHEELDRLSALSEKVSDKHSETHPELLEVRTIFEQLSEEFKPHLTEEEDVLFPMIRELASTPDVSEMQGDSLDSPISTMMHEHDVAGALLARLRDLTDGFDTPPDGCRSYAALYEGFAQLESDTHLHVHKENNLLFPQVLAMEKRKLAKR